MAGVLTFATDTAMLERYVTTTPITVHLFLNDRQPLKSDAVEDYVEPTGGGYVPRPLGVDEWTVDPGSAAVVTGREQVFICTGPVGQVYGYFLTDEDGELVGAERFAGAPFDLRRPGDRLVVTPTIATVSRG